MMLTWHIPIFGVTARSIFNWIKRKEQRPLAPNKTRKRRPNKIEGEKLKAYLQENPDSYLKEIAERLL
ncbi:IS630 transposase-related protein [Candidatus Rhabdochlamydia porcellionis]|jgi:transposase|uniref:IS630 transposase-related protein n=1 Tax=Candidatus Rhabdochlamydia porcellionis TaxID=225148 RepID=UPI001890F08D|nr:IS630 transposase-related protein [Candidatus Rhabdochlamydia porcellionis]